MNRRRRAYARKNEAIDKVFAEFGFGVKRITLSKNSIKRFTPKAARPYRTYRRRPCRFSTFFSQKKIRITQKRRQDEERVRLAAARPTTHLSSLTARLSSARSAASPASGAAERSMATSGSTAAASLRRCLADALVRRRTSRAASTSPARTRSTSARSAAASDGRSAAAAPAAGETGDASPDEHASGDSISVGRGCEDGVRRSLPRLSLRVRV